MPADVFAQMLTVVPGGDPVANVRISLHQTDGTFISAHTSGVDGRAFLGNLAAGTYEVRVTPTAPNHVVGSTLQTITVVDAVDQAFDIAISVSTLAPAVDDHFCRCSGYFIDIFGTPVADLSLHLSGSSVPALALYSGTDTTKAVTPSSVLIKTDSDGFASVDLLRGQEYCVYMEGYEFTHRYFLVPDLSAAPLPDVLFPVIDHLEYTDGGATVLPVSAPVLSLTTGSTKALIVYTLFRSGLKLTGLSSEINLSSSNEAVCTATISGDGTVTIAAVGAGTAELELSLGEPETGRGISILPDTSVSGVLAITVT